MDDRRELLHRRLRSHCRGELRFDAAARRLWSTDASHYQIEPLGVVLPRTTQDIVTAVQVALELGISITPRGGGTSLSGQSIGRGLVVDCSKYLHHVLDLDADAKLARVQPGLVLDSFNRKLAPLGLQFGPDVATASRANLGGMIGNNSAGARSVVYGKTVDHVRSLQVVLSDGHVTEFGPLSPTEWQQKARGESRAAAAYREVGATLDEHADEIERRFPKIVRRVSGYDLATTLQQRGRGLVPLLVGSEGTLGFVTEAEVKLVPRLKERGLLVPQFSSLPAALDALADCLAAGPSAVELLDQMLLDLAATQLSLKHAMAAVHGRPAALLMVEFASDDAGEVADKVEKLRAKLDGRPGLTACVPALEPKLRDPLWNLRSSAVPLLSGMPGDRKPVTFVEDTAVSPERLPEFAARFRDILRAHGTDATFYGHASVGCLHIRPVLNLKDGSDRAKMRRIMADITDLVLAFGGSLSGEHGDGLVRSEWNAKMFGPAVYGAFTRIKRAFDPDNRFNPGKVVNGPPMTDDLRPGIPGRDPVTLFDYTPQEGFFRSIEACNGSGVCRKTQGGAMCPSYRATLDERDSTRGRANALRHALTDSASLKGRWLYDVMDLCLMCKACKSECPANVDLAKLKSEFLQAHYAGKLRPLGQYLFGYAHRLFPRAAPVARFGRRLSETKLVRWLLERIAGIDRRRPLPVLHHDHFRRWFASRPISTYAKRVLLLDDCFTTFTEPNVGRAAVTVLERAGYRVELANVCCGRSAISKGFLHEARSLARKQVAALAQRVADGTPILGLEPSCLLTLADEWPELVPGAAARVVANSVHLAEAWLAQRVAANDCELQFKPTAERVLFHGHCHQKALVGVNGSTAALNLLPGRVVTALDSGCCGMAGSFGYEREHYDLSATIFSQSLAPALAADPGATICATGTSCRHQVRDFTGRLALHPLELLAQSLA